MKRYVISACSLLAFLIFCSKSCETPENEKDRLKNIELQATLDSIENSFLSETPSDQILRLLEEKAKQKLADLADYLQIYTDTTLDEAFREHARQMIRELFISDSARIKIRISKDEKETDLIMNKFLNLLSDPDKDFFGFIFDSIILSEPLNRNKDLNYTGSLEFLLRYDEDPDTSSIIAQSSTKKVDIIATKVRKPFGRDTLQIWQVYLGDIR